MIFLGFPPQTNPSCKVSCKSKVNIPIQAVCCSWAIMLHICSIMQQHVHFSTFNIKKYKNITQLQKSMPKRATVYQLSDMLPFLLVCSKYAANMLQNQILEEAHLLILICHAKKPLYTHFHALITICSVWLILAPTILYYRKRLLFSLPLYDN